MDKQPMKKRRADSFFGLHFDFHAKPAEDGELIRIGEKVNEQMVLEILDTVKPDYIQVDCKGHPGWSSYPTEAGNPYPGIEGDPLKIWRSATEKRGVALYMHYSGVVDDYQCEKHPEWARKGCDKDPDAYWIQKKVTSTFGPYVDEIMIPQLLELAGKYGVDGVWVDGDCWGTQPDYCDKAVEGFERLTGIDIRGNYPASPEDEHWYEYAGYCREQFREYLNRYVEATHEKHPGFQIASNWAYSSKMPEPVGTDVDFLSGDYLWDNSLNSARYEGRCLAGQGKPWDLMAWGFRWMHNDKFERCPKHPCQIKQEAAVVMALGGGFQSYYPQKKDGTVHMWQAKLMKEVAEFCRQREEFCHKAGFIPQAVLLNSTYYRYKTSKFLFQSESEDDALRGVSECLCESGVSFEILSEHNLEGRLDEYPLVILPETGMLEEGFRQKLLKYAKRGGFLMLIGNGPVSMFDELNEGEAECIEGDFLISADGVTWAYNNGRITAVLESGDTIGGIALTKDIDDGEAYAAADVKKFGEGVVARIFADIGEIYHTRKNHVHRDLIKNLLDKAYDPLVKVEGTMFVDLNVMSKNGKVMINLVNTSGSHANKDVFTIDEIPSTGPLTVTVKRVRKPEKVTLQPGNRSVESEWEDKAGLLRIRVPGVEIHDIIVIE